jgi:tetratricopeptide (TPR) repeat protein
MKRWLALIVVGLCLLAAADPLRRLGRLAMASGHYDAAAFLVPDPALKGVALYRAGRYAEAAGVLRGAGDLESTYNRGNALARLGAYAGAIDAYDAVLAREPRHSDAIANRALILAQLGPKGEPSSGTVGAGGTAEMPRNRRVNADDKDQNATGDGIVGVQEASLTTSGDSGRAVGRAMRDARFSLNVNSRGGGSGAESAFTTGSRLGEVEGARGESGPAVRGSGERLRATNQWVASIPDDPRRNLRIRIAVEQARRQAAGTAVPAGDDPW